MEKKISYLSRDFASIKDELLRFSEEYYPEIFNGFNDSSIGSWFIDMVSAVGDDLSYHTDRMYQETNIDSANLRSTVLNMARTNGLKIPGRTASACEVELSCELPIDGQNIAAPNWSYAPIVQRTSVVSAGNYNFELGENVNFAEQFNENGYSNRRIEPSRDTNGNIKGYKITKSVLAFNGTTKVYKKVLSSSDIEPFMEVVLPELNVMNIESIIFKESADINTTPSIYEYFIDAEEFRVSNEAVMTYRYFECDSLADQYRFGSESVLSGNNVANMYMPERYVEEPSVHYKVKGDDTRVYTNYNNALKAAGGVSGDVTTISCEGSYRYYVGQWKSLSQKFITEYTDNGYLKIIFGASNGHMMLPQGQTKYADHMMSRIVNNDMLGILPKEGWTMFVLYRVGGGLETNLGPGAINKITLANVDWKNTSVTDGNERGKVLNSMRVTNLTTALGGKDGPSTEEIKALIKYNTSSQNRAVTVKDYKIKMMQMPPKYGAPYRCSVAETNNKIEFSMLCLDNEGHLTSEIPSTLSSNMVEYISNYKMINDYIEFRSGRIYNIGVAADLFIDKSYDKPTVISNVINKIIDYFDVDNRDMGEDIFVGDLEKEINMLDGVISLISLRFYDLKTRHGNDECPMPKVIEGGACDPTPQDSSFGGEPQLDLAATDKVLYSDYNSCYEIREPSSDIEVRVKSV